MPFSHQRQITFRDILSYEDRQMKYECLPWIAFSKSEIFKVVFLECHGSCLLYAGWHMQINFSAGIWFGRHSKWIALISQEHCYLDCWMKIKHCMMQVSERNVEKLLSVWCTSQFWDLCCRLAIMLFAHVSFESFCLSTYIKYELVNPMIISPLPQSSFITWDSLSEHILAHNMKVPHQL